ncbi:endonuclease/exonuclease/phosphatase family protein [Colwellia echini]|uniref:Endonuclease n=1 Tax=Colwellia echini TaxID=1982103 RepID=A0ABY3N091_9GAMM|nr:endonuclease/exonuclease/phosphatase family protein [Colwellia echini]TYK66865.1 endonuclease [Colwellia echini]
MLHLLIICTCFIVIATLLPLSRHSHWIVRALDFPRLQIAIIAAALLIANLTLLDIQLPITKGAIAATAFCLIWQLWWILPYTILCRKEVKSATNNNPNKQLSILTSNVLTPNRNSDALIQLVRKHKPDILVTLESDQWWEDKLNVLEAEMPYSVKCPLDNLYGMHLYSRLPIEEQEISFLVEKDVPSIHACLVLKTGDKIRVHFVHPAPPSPTENTESAERDAELVIIAKSIGESVSKDINKSDLPIIVTGDLNDVAWSSTTRLFRKISGLLDPRVGRGMYNTFHADYPFLRWPLDHLFHSQHFTLHSIQRLPSIGSDHFPLLTRLVFSPIRGANQHGLQPDADDRERSKNIAQAQEVSMDDVPRPAD